MQVEFFTFWFLLLPHCSTFFGPVEFFHDVGIISQMPTIKESVRGLDLKSISTKMENLQQNARRVFHIFQTALHRVFLQIPVSLWFSCLHHWFLLFFCPGQFFLDDEENSCFGAVDSQAPPFKRKLDFSAVVIRPQQSPGES